MNDLVMLKRYKTLSAKHVPSLLQALSGKCETVSRSGHSSLVALCSLVSSQVGP